MRALFLAFILGNGLGLSTVSLFLCASIVALLLCLLSYFYPKRHMQYIALGLLLGLTWVFGYAKLQTYYALPSADLMRPIQVQGVVVSVPSGSHHATHFLFKLTALQQQAQWQKYSYLVKLNWYYPTKPLRLGQHWQFSIKLKPNHSYHNPGSFDYAQWLRINHIAATGYIKNNATRLLPQKHDFLLHIRESLHAAIVKTLPQQNEAAIINALCLGIKEDITSAQWQIFKATGTAHLIAISGLHVSLVAGCLIVLMRFFLARILFLRRCNQHLIACLVAISVASFYCLITGLAVPTIRALVMLSLFTLALILKRKTSLLDVVIVTLTLMVAANPLQLLNVSFVLSFAAVIVLLYGLNARIAKKNSKLASVKMHLLVFTGLMPFLSLFFQQLSLVAIAANLLAVPVVSFFILPLSLFGCACYGLLPALASFIWQISASIIHCLWLYLSYLSTIPHAVIPLVIPSCMLFLLVLLAVLILNSPQGLPGKLIAFIWLLPLFFYHYPRPAFGNAWLAVLDVGQGLASVLVTQHHVLIYDTGPKFNDDSDMGKTVVIPYLKTLGLRHIDRMVISHGDNDHIGGAQSILENFKTTMILSSIPQKLFPFKAEHCYRGQHWQWDGVDFKILYPPRAQVYQDNNSSCVLQVSVDQKKILLTGDIEKIAEAQLVRLEKARLASTVLIAPHHGSNTSSSPIFINAVNPRYVLFATGFHNRFHFPSKKVVQRYQARATMLFNTADCGAIVMQLLTTENVQKPSCFYRPNGLFY